MDLEVDGMEEMSKWKHARNPLIITPAIEAAKLVMEQQINKEGVRDYFERTPHDQDQIRKTVILPEPKVDPVKVCSVCNGTGKIEHDCDCHLCDIFDEACPECDGTGKYEV